MNLDLQILSIAIGSLRINSQDERMAAVQSRDLDSKPCSSRRRGKAVNSDSMISSAAIVVCRFSAYHRYRTNGIKESERRE